MKIVKLHRKLSSVLKLSLALFFSFSLSLSAQDKPSDEQVKAGKALFNMHCASCHKLDKKSTGPALSGVAERRDMDWLKAWIKNNNKLRASGDADAKAIYEEYGGVAMSVFEFLSDEQIEDIIAYTTVGDVKKAGAATAVQAVEAESTPSQVLPMIATVVVTLVLLALIGWVFLKSNNGFLKIVSTIVLVFLGVYFGFTALMSVGVDEGYQPVQPIAFSHKIHAGDNKIDCQYCHSSAKHSKTSGIPSVNVCMNCHKNISEVADDTKIDTKGKAYLDKEIQKVYEAAGWDSENLKYTGETKPVKWVRIHNLPDFAYFNHSQHVTVAGVKCQKCHGPVEEMDELYQYAPLTMGWCIECHKETEVNIAGNGYYKKIHEQLSQKYGVDKVTIAQLGGKECGKCHY
ncbi:c-type cytochrome [Wenyingzhuangia marina]|uniref:Quinol:cytochrome c oxidoreductase pentaheme cytochrome subunit n=1 Tax=Wenyingzhuangia marina TaxID=1195760 RepID=A0A1M5RXE4_9FLAO|nr:c-type cytochrome [Wenyingzhuangia marina]GGF78099.1 cytochrome c [Wenyingzhuangia marina]SHH31022.1 quinol:cytochrome c oxidoreductase pentaheme cytochrome subunit [Wenyingzhuangia marina]